MTAVLLLVPVAAVLAAWGAVRVLRRRGRLLRGAVAVVTALVVLLGGLQLWALAALDSSAVALALVEGRLPAGTLDEVTDRDGDERPLGQLAEDSATEALVVLRDDEVVYEWYGNGGAAEQPHTSFSVAKSFLSTLVGIAIDRGDIESLDDPVTDHVPELLGRDHAYTLTSPAGS